MKSKIPVICFFLALLVGCDQTFEEKYARNCKSLNIQSANWCNCVAKKLNTTLNNQQKELLLNGPKEINLSAIGNAIGVVMPATHAVESCTNDELQTGIPTPSPEAKVKPTESSAQTPAPQNTELGPQDPALARIDGRWYSDEWQYGYRLRAGEGTATISNSPNFKPGDKIIFLNAVSETRFEGEQVYKDGKFYRISVNLMPDGRLAFQGERGVKWIMRRDD